MGRSEFLIPDRMPLGDGSLNGKAAFIAGVEVTLFPDGWPSGNRSTTIESGREAMSSEVFWDGSPVVRTIGFQPNSRRCRQNRSDRCTPGVIFGGNSVRIKRQLRTFWFFRTNPGSVGQESTVVYLVPVTDVSLSRTLTS